MNEKNLDSTHGTLISDHKSFLSDVSYILYNWVRKLGYIFNTVFSDVGSGITVKRKVFDTVGGFNEELENNEDILFLKSVIKAGFKYKISNLKIVSSDRRFRGITIFDLLRILFAGVVGTTISHLGLERHPISKKMSEKYWKNRDYTK